MNARLTAGIASLLLAWPVAAQVHDDNVQIIVPNSRNVVIHAPRRPPDFGPVRLTAVDVQVDVRDEVSVTTLAMTLTNPSRRPQEARLLMPVPEGAVVRSFGLDGLGPEPTARLLPRDEAREIYRSIVSRMLDPGLVEFAGFNLIQSSVFPVPAGGTSTMRLTFERFQPPVGNRLDYVLPRTEALEATGVSWRVSMDIRTRTEIVNVYSPSHDLVTERLSKGHVRVTVPAGRADEPGALRVSCLTAGREGVAASLVAYPDPSIGRGDGGYFLVMAGVPAGDDAERKPVPRELTIVLDRSGSMRGTKLDQAREAALQVIEGLSQGETFNIIDYSSSVEAFSERPVAKSPMSMARAREYLAGLTASGGTNIHDALVEALRQPATEGAIPVVLFLTDGLATLGPTSERAIREAAEKANTHHRRIFTFGVGTDVNSPLLSNIALRSRATPTFVLPGEDIEVKVGQVFDRLRGPILDSPRITVIDADGKPAARLVRELMPRTLPDLFEGDMLVLTGQYLAAGPVRLRLEGNYFGRPRTFDFSLDTASASTRHGYVPRLWASWRIADLVEQIRYGAPDGAGWGTADPRFKELVDEIVRLSVAWGILTEYTAFLAVEPDMAPDARLRLGLAPAGQTEGMAPSAMPARAEERLRDLAVEVRGGAGGVSQELNREAQKASKLNSRNNVLDDSLSQHNFTSVRQIADKTLFNRAGRWVDAAILEHEAEAPDLTVQFGSTAYLDLVEDLATQNRQGILAVSGDVYLLNRGQRILVKGPAS